MKREANTLVDDLIKDGWLKTPEIIEAFRKIKRQDFLPARIGYAEGVAGGPDDIKHLAELNEALPIGFGQTISQPLTVAFMLELLQPREGDKILDVGAGSGWTTTLLAYCVSQKGNSKFQNPNPKQILNSKFQIQNGKVVAIEIVPELAEFGRKNIAKYNFIKKGVVEFFCADGSKGYAKQAPYDKILVSASGQREPEELKKQLKIGGRMVLPIENSIWLFAKKNDNKFQKKEYPGFVFVPLVQGPKFF